MSMHLVERVGVIPNGNILEIWYEYNDENPDYRHMMCLYEILPGPFDWRIVAEGEGNPEQVGPESNWLRSITDFRNVAAKMEVMALPASPSGLGELGFSSRL